MLSPATFPSLTAHPTRRPDTPAPAPVLTGPPGVHVGPSMIPGCVVVVAYDSAGGFIGDMTLAEDVWQANAANIAVRFEQIDCARRRARMGII